MYIIISHNSKTYSAGYFFIIPHCYLYSLTLCAQPYRSRVNVRMRTVVYLVQFILFKHVRACALHTNVL